MANSLVFLIALFVWWYDGVYGQSSYRCHDAYECQLDTISDSSSSGSNIECYGYYSCTQATRITSSGNAYIYCYGGYSCAEAGSIEHTGSSERHILCYGSFSCAYVNDIYNEDGLVECFGELSCAESIIVTDRNDIYCSAARSCYGSNVTSSADFYFHASLAAQNAIIISDASSVNLYVWGYDSTYGAQLICSGTCNVNCNAGGCNNFSLGCAGAGGSCTINTNCNSAEQSEACPNGYVLPDYLSIPSLIDTQFSTYNNSYRSCSTSINSAVNCDDYQECYNSGTYNENTPMCCTSYEACERTTNINTNINVNDTNVYKTAFRADGYYSANQMSGTVFAESGGNIYLAGAYANSDTSSSYKTTIKTNGNGDIIVSGYEAAYDKILTQARNLYCLGYEACTYGTISSISGMVHASGAFSLRYASISDVDGSVYCAGQSNCLQTTMSNISGNVICIGYRCLYNSYFYNVNNTVAGYGEESLYSTSMDNVANV